jgi:hypothetical protein
MINVWYYYFFPLAISVTLVIGALVMLRRSIRGDLHVKGRPYGLGTGCVSIPVGGIGVALGVAILLSPTPWQRQRLFNRVFHTPPEDIERFVILAGRGDQYEPLTRSEVVIDDPAQIQRIAEILRTVREIAPNQPRIKWTATVEMVTRDGTFYFRVEATVPGDANRTLVSAQTTKEGGGWNLGEVRAEGLDQVLEDAVHKARGP